MKQIRLLSGLLGVLFFVCQTQAAALSGLDLLKPENFKKLSVDDKVIVVSQLRQALVDISRESKGDLDFAQLDKDSWQPSLWRLAFPAAFAGSTSNMCIPNGVITPKVDGVCPDIKKGECIGSARLCEPTLYGPNQCAIPSGGMQGCEDLMKLPGADQRVADYLKDPNNQKIFTDNQKIIVQRCSQDTSLTCTTLNSRMSVAASLIDASSVAGSPASVPDVPPETKAPRHRRGDDGYPPPPPLPNGDDPALATNPPGPAPIASAVTAPPPRVIEKKTVPVVDLAADREAISKEMGAFGKCDQWKLAEETVPDMEDSKLPLLMSFHQAQQMVCEHKPFTAEDMNAIEARMKDAVSKVAYNKKGGGHECKTKSRRSVMGQQCTWLLGTKGNTGLLQNLELCKAEMAKYPVDEKWAKAVRAAAGVVVKPGLYTSPEAYENLNGSAPVQIEFKANYKEADTLPETLFKGRKTHSMTLNGKYISRTLAAYRISICDVHREEPGAGAPSAPTHRSSGPSRTTASVPGPSWVVPSLPQGAPGGNSNSTSGQGH